MDGECSDGSFLWVLVVIAREEGKDATENLTDQSLKFLNFILSCSICSSSSTNLKALATLPSMHQDLSAYSIQERVGSWEMAPVNVCQSVPAIENSRNR